LQLPFTNEGGGTLIFYVLVLKRIKTFLVINIQIFSTALSTFLSLKDLEMQDGNFTWSNNSENPTLERLDRVLLSKYCEVIFPLTDLRKIPRDMSDHNPVLLCSDHNLANLSA